MIEEKLQYMIAYPIKTEVFTYALTMEAKKPIRVISLGKIEEILVLQLMKSTKSWLFA